MDKREFLNRLQAQLTDLTDEERGEALEYYEEYFADAGEENEEDVIGSLGMPEQVAEQIKAGLHKEEKGMFTENGYREKVESDNPPEVYDGKAEKQKKKGFQTWRKEKRTGAGYQNTSHGYSQNSYGYRTDGYNDNSYHTDGYHSNNNNSNGYHNGGQNGYGYGEPRTGKKKDKMSGGMIALLVILGICAAPVILAMGAALFGVILGILGAVLGVVMALFAIVLALLAAGVGLFIGGIPMLFYRPFSGMICIAVGCFLIALFLLCAVLLVLIFSRFFPWLIREVESFGKYLSRKWSERKERGETV